MYINDTEHRGIVSCIASMSIQTCIIAIFAGMIISIQSSNESVQLSSRDPSIFQMSQWHYQVVYYKLISIC